MSSSMMKSLCQILTLFALVATCRVAAVAQDCATVTLVGSAVQNTFVQAPVNIVNCRDNATQLFVDASVNTASSDSTVARAVGLDTTVIASDGTSIVKISAQPVTVCKLVTLSFTFRFKVKGIDGTVGPERVTKVTKTFIVCPFRLDAQVVALAVVPAEAGQESQVTLTLVNQGAQTPLPGGGGSYRVNLTIVEDTSALVRDSCSPISSVGLVSFPQLRPGEQQTLTRRFRFPQAGAFTLKAEVSLFESEDGPTNNNSRAQAVTVPLPRPLVCEVAPLTTRPGDPVKISGNWFRTFGTTETPTVRFGSVEAQVINVASPLNLTVRMPDLTCTASGQVIVTVTNSTGATAFRNESTFPGTVSITGISRIASPSGAEEDLTINLVNFRPNCRFTVTLEPGPLTPGGALTPQVLSATVDRIVVRIRRPNSVAAYTVKMETPYGIATKPFSLGGQLGSVADVLDSLTPPLCRAQYSD
jgi:hypothetical protein